MSASQLDIRQLGDCAYGRAPTSTPSSSWSIALSTSDSVGGAGSCGGVVAVAEFGRASAVDSNVVTRPPTNQNGEQRSDAQTTREHANASRRPCSSATSTVRATATSALVGARHELSPKQSNPCWQTDTPRINNISSGKEEEPTQQQFHNHVHEQSPSPEQIKHQNNHSEAALNGLQDGSSSSLNRPTIQEKTKFHDSISRGTSGTIAESQARLWTGETATLQSRNRTSEISDSASTTGANMGYSSTSGQIAWQVPLSDFSGNNNNNSKTMVSPTPPHHMLSANGHAPTSSSSSQHERKEQLNDEDSTTIRSIDSASLGSPSHGPLNGPPALEPTNAAGHATGAHSTATTPSTVSTAPSTNDEGSMGALDPNALERLALRGEPLDSTAALYHQHRGAAAGGPPGPWEHYQSHLFVPDETDQGTFSTTALPPPSQPTALPVTHHTTTANSWAAPRPVQHQRVASFRNDLPSNGVHEPRWHHHPPLRYDSGPVPPPLGTAVRSINNKSYAAPPMPYAPYHHPVHRGGVLATATPPRTTRPNRPMAAASSAAPNNHPIPTGGPAAPGNPRSPSEVLKTLLRKKACLYEPDTSRAVALVTWLVGRELALEFGYFSRQQLQAGVHACVAGKIDSGVITRTKVNRCMQIILNSCFHYIIPRPDGSEEKGDAFRSLFAQEVTNDVALLQDLPAPWNDLSVNRVAVLEASLADVEAKPSKTPTSTPQTSPRLGSVPAEKTSPRSKEEGADGVDNKRAVLLCFNENVRCAEDVFRCHNEFIRDTAHASGLQLSSTEWRSFFGREAASAQQLWGNIGIPVPRAANVVQSDVLGMMTQSELAKFRTTWCAKRYDHDHELCGFAHVEVNGGWLRRNFLEYKYGMELCPDVVEYPSAQEGRKYIVNACPRGVYCGFAHSQEEILYHPRRYKNRTCPSLSRLGGCSNGDVCPDLHPVDSYKFPSKKSEGRMNARQSRQQGTGSPSKTLPPPPNSAPILYCTPAPVSRFEEQFQMPGLKNLYRRHCSVMKAHLRNPASCFCCYSCFGDDDGTAIDPMQLSESFKKKPGLPQPRGV